MVAAVADARRVEAAEEAAADEEEMVAAAAEGADVVVGEAKTKVR